MVVKVRERAQVVNTKLGHIGRTPTPMRCDYWQERSLFAGACVHKQIAGRWLSASHCFRAWSTAEAEVSAPLSHHRAREAPSGDVSDQEERRHRFTVEFLR